MGLAASPQKGKGPGCAMNLPQILSFSELFCPPYSWEPAICRLLLKKGEGGMVSDDILARGQEKKRKERALY